MFEQCPVYAVQSGGIGYLCEIARAYACSVYKFLCRPALIKLRIVVCVVRVMIFVF